MEIPKCYNEKNIIWEESAVNYDVFISYNSSDIRIAEAVCHYIEERRLRCFIAPRDITPPDWAASITGAIESAKAFVIIVSEGSIASNEVAKEITLATRVSDYIFPFRIDNTELSGRMTYHLAPFHWIDAVTPPMEKRLNELADRVAASLQGQVANQELGNLSGSCNKSRQRLLGQSLHPRSEFIGRSSELRELHSLFSSGCNAVFLTGMGGIGKSEIAKAYAQQHRNLYTTAVFASYETDLLHLIASDQAIPVENLQQASATGGQGETAEAYFERKMKVLRSIVNENTLLIIDNFDVEADDRLEDVLQLPCKLLITTRTDFSAYGYETMRVGPMENFEDLVTLMERIDRVYPAADRAALEDIIRLLDCHTYAVSLTAAQMKAGRIKPSKMLSQLREEGLHIQTRSSFAREAGAKKATAYEYIRALFDFSRLDDTACRILRYMACMPREGVDIDLFMECCGIEDFGDISRLTELNWVQLDEENDRIGLHMLVKELVWEQLTPTEDNCEALLQGAYRWANNAWNKPHEENCSHSSIIFSLLETFPAPPIQWLDAFEDMATFAWIQGRFDLSECCEHHLYQLCVNHHGEISVQAGSQALRVAAVYYNQADYNKARPWYEKGLQVQESIDPNGLHTWQARIKVARSDGQRGQYELALAAFQKNLAIVRQHLENNTYEGEDLRKMYIRLAATRQYIAQILACMGRYQEALDYAQLARDYLVTDTVEPSLVIYIDGVLAYIYQGMGDYTQAMAYTEAAMESMIHYHGTNRIDTLLYQENLGDLQVRQGNYSEAAEKYVTALGGREKLYPADIAAIERLEMKLDCAKQGKPSEIPFLIMWP